MKNKCFFLFLIIFSVLLVFSCESLPEPSEDAEPVPETPVVLKDEEPPEPEIKSDISEETTANTKNDVSGDKIENAPVSVEPTVVTFDVVDDVADKNKTPETKTPEKIAKTNTNDTTSKEVSSTDSPFSENSNPKELNYIESDKNLNDSSNKTAELDKNAETEKETPSSTNQDEKYTEKSWTDDTISDGIWEYEKGGVLIPLQEEQEDLVEKRNVTVSPGQKLEVKLPGSGWVFSRATGNASIFDFSGKKIEVSDTVFIFTAKKPGTCELNFSRFDVISDSYTDFALTAVIEGDNKVGIVRWDSFGNPKTVPTTVIKNDSKNDLKTKKDDTDFSSTKPKSSSSNLSGITEEPELELLPADSENSNSVEKAQDFRGLTPTQLLSQANDTLTKGDVNKALDMLNYYVTAYSDGLDKVWYLLGQAYEKESDMKDIKKSRESYQKVVSAFPFSVWWQPSKERITYIDRFYFNVR